MSSTLPSLPLPPHRGHYTPYLPSPLSPRDRNIRPTHLLSMSMSSPPSGRGKSENQGQKKMPFSKRVTRVNPLIHNRGDGREARRNLFLRKVRDGAEEKRWEARGGNDEVMRTIWFAEEQRRIESQAREALSVTASLEKELEDYEGSWASNTTQNTDEEMVDEIAQQEDAEIEALLLLMSEQDRSQPRHPLESLDTPYGSDDEEYDYLFMSVIEEELVGMQSGQSQDRDMSVEEMDIS